MVTLQDISKSLPQRLTSTADIVWPESKVKELQGLCSNFQKMAASLQERQDALMASQRQAAFLADLVESSSQPFAGGGLDGRITVFNAAFPRLLGYSTEELPSVNWIRDLTPPEWQERTRASLLELQRTGQPVRYEKEYFRKDGSRLPVDLFLHMRRDDKGKADLYYVFATDITARQQAEAALRKSEERLNLALEAAKMGVWEWNLKTDDLFWSPECFKILGEVGFTGRLDSFIKVVHPEDIDRVMTTMKQALDQRVAYAEEFRVFHASGEVFWVANLGRAEYNDNGQPQRLVGIVQDITARRQAEAALRESMARERQRAAELQGVLDAAPQPIFMTFSPDIRHMTGNPAAYSLLNLPVGSNVSKDAPAEERQAYKALKSGRELPNQELPLQRALSGEVVQSFEFDLALADGTVRHVSANAVPLFDERGTPRGGVTVLTDLTAYKKSQEELLRAHDELEQRVEERTAQLRRQAEEIQDLYDNAPCGYHSLDAAGVFVRMNNTELEWLGYTRDEVIGRLKFSDIMTAEGSRRNFRRSFPDFIKQGRVEGLEYELVCRDGTTLPVLLNATAVTDDAGNFPDEPGHRLRHQRAQRSRGSFKGIRRAAPVSVLPAAHLQRGPAKANRLGTPRGPGPVTDGPENGPAPGAARGFGRGQG